MQKQENEYAVMKVLLTILVVVQHIIVFFSDIGGVIEMPVHWLLNDCFHYIYIFSMPLFIFISGAVYSQGILSGKYRDSKGFIIKKFKRLMIPYFAWGICYVAPVMRLLKITESSFGDYILKGILLAKDNRHLWFLWTLFFIFVIMKAIQPVFESSRLMEGIIFLGSFILCYYSWDLPGIFGINSIVHYLFYFILGYLFEENRIIFEKIFKGRVYFSWILLAGTVFLEKMERNNFNIKFILPILCIFMIYGFVLNLDMNLCTNMLYLKIKRKSFGIYLAHPMIIYIMFWIMPKSQINAVIVTIIIGVIAFIGSYILTEGIRRTKFKWILGE